MTDINPQKVLFYTRFSRLSRTFTLFPCKGGNHSTKIYYKCIGIAKIRTRKTNFFKRYLHFLLIPSSLNISLVIANNSRINVCRLKIAFCRQVQYVNHHRNQPRKMVKKSFINRSYYKDFYLQECC